MIRGHIDNTEVGDGFLFIEGWVCEGDTEKAAEPLTISVSDEAKFALPLYFRSDLRDAAIASGFAAFSMALPFQGPNYPDAVTIVDRRQQTLTIPLPRDRLRPFFPRGTIDSIGPEGIYGWLFDPAATTAGAKTRLVVDSSTEIDLPMNFQRNDLPYTVASGGVKVFGFLLGIDKLLPSIRNRRGPALKRPIELILQSGPHKVWRHHVHLTGENSSGHALPPPADLPLPPPQAVQTGSRRIDDRRPRAAGAAPAAKKAGASREPVTVKVVSWDMGHNPVGRAFLLADIASQVSKATLSGPLFPRYGTALWGPLRDEKSIPIDTFPGGPLADYIRTILPIVDKAQPVDVVYASKARLPSMLYGMLMKLRHGSAFVVDVDDHELSFFKDVPPLGLDEALDVAKASPNLAEMPFDEVWTRLSETLVRHADAVTVSNVALQRRFGGTIIRHARNEAKFKVSPERRRAIRSEFGLKDSDIAVIFAGTPRPHKGIFEIADALERINDERLVFVVIGTINDKSVSNAFRRYKAARILRFEDQPFERLHEIASIGDVAPILQRPGSEISAYQIPAKLTDAMALGIPALTTRVPPLEDLLAEGICPIVDGDLEQLLRARLADPKVFDRYVRKATEVYRREFTYAANAQRLSKVFGEAIEAARQPASRHLAAAVERILEHAGVELPATYRDGVASPAIARRQRDLVFFWKQNDTDLYGRRSDMMLKYLLETGKIRRVLHLDRPRKLVELQETIDYGPYANFHEGNLVFRNSVERILKMRDTGRVAKRTFLHRDGSKPQSFLGRDLPPADTYLDFIKEEMTSLGMDPSPMAWVCPVVFDFPALHREFKFDPVVVDIIDDQRRWKASDGYMQKVVRNYEEVLQLGSVVLANCEPVKVGFRDLRDDIQVIPNGAEIFAEDENFPVPADLRELPRPIVGYVGNLRDRIDVKLIERMAEENPHWSIALIGSARGALDVLALNEVPNIHLFGVRQYETALSYIKHFDVAIMPHAHNAISENMNPLKLYVYFALGVPIVTSDVANIGDIGPYVHVAKDHEDFIGAVKNMIASGPPPLDRAVRNGVLDKVSWRTRVATVMRELSLNG